MYKAPSQVHETVVHTLIKEKNSLNDALRNQREANQQMGDKFTQMSIRMDELEKENKKLVLVQSEDQRALIMLDQRLTQATSESDQLRQKLQESEFQLEKARSSENRAYEEADNAAHNANNYKEDVSFLTQETKRLNEELRNEQ